MKENQPYLNSSNNIWQIRNPMRVLNHPDIVQRKVISNNESTIGLLEFHPTDMCDLSCFYCTYQQKKKETFPFSQLDRLKVLSPRAIVITGGGEPTEYQSGKKSFVDLILKLREIFPKTIIGLTTNGQHLPSGNWQQHISWIRISIDALDDSTFLVKKGGSLKQTLNNLSLYIESPIAQIGIGFVFSRFNILQVTAFIEKTVDYVLKKCGPKGLNKLNFQFRPACMIESCHCPSTNYQKRGLLMVPDEQEWWKSLVDKQRDLLFGNLTYFPWWQKFIKQRVNLNHNEFFNYITTKPIFRNCYLSLIRILVKSDGSVYPCVMKASNGNKAFVNILKDQNYKNKLISSQRKYYSLKQNLCVGSNVCCRIDGYKNELIEKAIDEATPFAKPSTNSDYFF